MIRLIKQSLYIGMAALLLLVTLTAAPAGAGTLIPGLPGGIDAGATAAYTTADGVTFEADYGRSGGVVRTSSGDIAYTQDDALYHSRVVAPMGQEITYQLSPPPGVTEMRIMGHFNEHHHESAGRRLIDVQIRCPGSAEPWNSGVRVEEELDIFAAAADTYIDSKRNLGLVRYWGEVDVSGGEVEITISANAASPDAALISAIEFGEALPRIPSLPSGINVGSDSTYTTADGVTFEADYGRSGGEVRTSSGDILETEDDPLYHTLVEDIQEDGIVYHLAVPHGVTRMQIIGHFSDYLDLEAGSRWIDVVIRCPGSAYPWNRGVLVEDEMTYLDGANKALVRNWWSGWWRSENVEWTNIDVSGGEVEIRISTDPDGHYPALISALKFAEAPPESAGGVNAGANYYNITEGGIVFSDDTGRSGGFTRSSSGEIENTRDDWLYRSRAVAPIGETVTYRITPPQGITRMQFRGHFNEHHHQSAGRRLVDVLIRCQGSPEPWHSGVVVEAALDIFASAGNRNTALLRDWGAVDVSGGDVEVILSASSDSPDAALINAIEYVGADDDGS